jgi:outer membrane protein OmpA-like peptidoglycan-associated protein
MTTRLKRVVPAILFLLLLVIIQVDGQENNSQKALKFFEKAKSDFDAGNWKDCESDLDKAIVADSTLADPYIMMGDVYLETGRPEEAVKQYTKAFNLNPKHVDIVCNLLANTLFSLERYEEASGYYEKLLAMPYIGSELKKTVDAKLKTSLFRISMMENPVAFNPVNMGFPVNTEADEYINALAADGSGIFFTRRVKNPAGQMRAYFEDFYFAKFTGDSLKNVVKLDYPPGKENDAAALCISADGRLLFFTACFRPDSYGGCDLYFSEKIGDKWVTARNMGSQVNSDGWDSQPFISPDGKTLYFASNRPGGMGSSDIWKTERKSDGSWGKPVNLGKPVNTAESEMAPFIHYDNQTLYYSSAGNPGMGGADLFKSVHLNGIWTQPENLGYPINTRADELVIIVDPAGKSGFISSNSLKGNGGYDIFRFELYDAIRPVPVTYLKGKVFDKISGLPLEARFELIDIKLDSTIVEATSDRQNGEFLVCLPGNRDYALNVSHDGYLFYSDNFPLSEIKTQLDPVLKDIPLEPIAVGKSMTLRNIFYETDQYQLKTISYAELDKLFSFLRDNPALRIEIGGHTDNVGTDEYNIDLSMKRARAVYEYLLSKGIDAGRISYKGYGESVPVSSNETEEGRALNRRTEITILKSG